MWVGDAADRIPIGYSEREPIIVRIGFAPIGTSSGYRPMNDKYNIKLSPETAATDFVTAFSLRSIDTGADQFWEIWVHQESAERRTAVGRLVISNQSLVGTVLPTSEAFFEAVRKNQAAGTLSIARMIDAVDVPDGAWPRAVAASFLSVAYSGAEAVLTSYYVSPMDVVAVGKSPTDEGDEAAAAAVPGRYVVSYAMSTTLLLSILFALKRAANTEVAS